MKRPTWYERRHESLLPRGAFLVRLARHATVGGGLVLVSLAIGVFGYHAIAGLDWIDSIENAAMILTGMGPVSPMPTDGAKLFASAYALFSGVVFVTSIGVVVTPVLHRLLHHFHVEDEETG